MSLTVIITISVIAVFLNIALSFAALESAQRKGYDPMPSFIAVMLFSLIGFIAVIFLEDRTGNEVDSKGSQKECILFYSEEDKRFRMMSQGEIIKDEYELEVLGMYDVTFKLKEVNGALTHLNNEQAFNYMHKHLE